MDLILHTFKETPWLFYAFVAYMCLCVGSFLNVVIYRLPLILNKEWQDEAHQILHPDQPLLESNKVSLLLPKSHCPSCKTPIKWYHNIPLFGWIFLGGKCSHCKSKISARYPFVELLTMTLGLLVAVEFGVTIHAVYALIFTFICIALFFIDLDHQILPDRLVYPLIALGLLVNAQTSFVTPSQAIYGAAIGFFSLWIIYITFKFITGKEGMGYGDFKLMCALGAWFGPLFLHYAFLFSAVSGLIFVIATTIIHKLKNNEDAKQQAAIAFGPHIVIAGWLIMYLELYT